jgi:hypothetical protein
VFVYTDPINSPGYFSEAMIINTASTNTPDVNGKKYAFIHELGHVIGMAHTDAVVNGTSIFNTTLTCNDSPVSNSIMYSFGAYNQTFSAFSTCDKNNFKSYWGF